MGARRLAERVILGLSGGVDSAVAASLLKERYDVLGVYLDVGVSPAGAEQAAETAGELGIPFRRVDIRAALEREVCAPFAESYLSGRTPLPCAVCNPRVKFPALLTEADREGATFIATGHYARTEAGVDGRALLLKGCSPNDQSYLLSRLPQGILKRTLFPLGGYDKTAVRALAQARGLSVAHRAASMEICFIPEDDYAAWLDCRYSTPGEGDFVDREGRVLGRHKGYHHYTLGQGRGLGVSGPHRYFVSAIRPSENQVVLSDGSDLYARSVFCADPNWISGEEPEGSVEVMVRLRHSRTEQLGRVFPAGGKVTVRLAEPARAPTPGQLAVFYQGEAVLGSAWIEGAEP